MIVLTASLIALLAAINYGSWISHKPTVSGDSWDLFYHLGGYSPWIPKISGVVIGDIGVPKGCAVDQVHILARHGERFPTMLPGMLELYQRLQRINTTFCKDMAFVHKWNFFAPHPNEQFEQLTNTGPYAGTLEAFATGVKLRTRYIGLLEDALRSNQTTFWASQSDRVIDTARIFATGFYGIDWEKSAYLDIIPETKERGGDTLTPGRACPNYATDQHGHRSGVTHLDDFRSIYLPQISARLLNQNPGVSFSNSEIYAMQEMCGFEILAKGHSEWCKVFTQDEMLGFEYARDILHYFRAGPGNKFGPSMGWLWLNATNDLLRQGADAGPLFISFVHDSDMIAMLAALDLFPQAPHLPTTHVLHNRTWKTSDVVPMGGRIIFERLSCPAAQGCWSNAEYGYPNHVYCEPPKNDTYVRININDGIVPIPDCDDGSEGSGLCELHNFSARIRRRGQEIPSFEDLCGLDGDVPKRIQFLHQ